MKFPIATLTGAMLAANAAAAPFINERAPADATPADTDLLPTVYWVIAGEKRDAEDIAKRVPTDATPADTDLLPTVYWVIAGEKRDAEEVDRVKREAAEHIAREIDTRLAKRDDDSSFNPNDIIIVSVVHAVKAKKGSVNAYSDYVDSADAKEILGE